jgi:hypothetical protein
MPVVEVFGYLVALQLPPIIDDRQALVVTDYVAIYISGWVEIDIGTRACRPDTQKAPPRRPD